MKRSPASIVVSALLVPLPPVMEDCDRVGTSTVL